jgi:hypothetical protein
VHRIDPRLFVTGSFTIFALTLFMRSRFNTDADVWTLLVPTLIQGAGAALFFIPLVTLSLSGLAPERIPSASGLFNFARITFGSFGTSIATTFWDRRASLHHAQLAEHVTRFDASSGQALGSLQGGGLSPDQSLAAVNHLIDQQAFMLSVNDMFYASALAVRSADRRRVAGAAGEVLVRGLRRRGVGRALAARIQPTRTTIFPRAWPPSRSRWASATSSSAMVRSTCTLQRAGAHAIDEPPPRGRLVAQHERDRALA